MKSTFFLVSLSLALAFPQDQPTFEQTGEQARAQVAETAKGWKSSVIAAGSNLKNDIAETSDAALGATIQGSRAALNAVGNIAQEGKDKFRSGFSNLNDRIQGTPSQ